jgi:signal transduction histidine kinase
MRFLRWSGEGVTDLAAGIRMTAWPTALVVGLGAEWLARSGQSLAAVAADLAVGWALIASGLLGWARRPQSRVGPLIALSGFGWFFGTLSGSRIGAVAAFGTALLFLHRGPLCHVIVGYPTGRPAGLLGMIVVVAAYVYAAAVPLARSDVLTIVVALAVLVAVVGGYAPAAGPDRRARATAVAAAAALAVPLVGGSMWRLLGAGSGAEHAVLWGYEAVLVLIAAGFLADLSWGQWAQAAVTKLVVDLGGDPETGTLRARLAHALGDRSLMIAYWLPDAGGYVDERGNQVELPQAGSGKAVTVVGHDGEQIAALVHDIAVLDDPGLVDSVARAARIALSNVRLRADVQRRVAELTASRRRIVEAGDTQRRRLQQQLQASAGRHLTGVGEFLDLAVREARTSHDRGAADRLAAARRELEAARAGLRELAAGIHPALLTERGLGAALASLAERSAVPVRLAAPSERLPAVIETVVYFVCSEALANVAKHAGATRADIRVRLEGDLVTVSIADDGTGGADPSAGSGLKGVADRVEALGGRLLVHSPPSGGTQLRVQIPAVFPRTGPGGPRPWPRGSG